MRTLYLLLIVACGRASAERWPFLPDMNEHELNHNELNEHAQDNCLRQPPINSRVSQQICCQATPLHGMFYKCAAEDVQRNMLRRMEREQRRNRRREWRTRNSTVSTTTTTQSPPIETDEEPRARFVCYLENSTMFDRSYRMQTKAVLEVAMCAFGANSSYAPSVPHFVDHCVAAYGAAVQAMPDDMLHPEYGCLSRSTFLVECLHDQFFVHCPADKWNSGMESGCEDWKTYKSNCPSYRMRQIYRDLLRRHNHK